MGHHRSAMMKTEGRQRRLHAVFWNRGVAHVQIQVHDAGARVLLVLSVIFIEKIFDPQR
jgi:hypothetical protein